MNTKFCSELSDDAKTLLGYLSTTQNFLTHRFHWKAIPTFGARYDDRIDWQVNHPECVQDLIDLGFIEPVPASEVDYGTSYDSNAIFHIPKENEIYRVSEAGHSLVKSWVD